MRKEAASNETNNAITGTYILYKERPGEILREGQEHKKNNNANSIYFDRWAWQCIFSKLLSTLFVVCAVPSF